MPRYAVTVVGEVTKYIQVECENIEDAGDAAEVAFEQWLNEQCDIRQWISSWNAQDDPYEMPLK
mgnify:CR=1 FL=1